jgi:hypothetical protein
VARQRISVPVPELFLGLLSLAVAAVWIGHIVTSMVVDARRTRDTIVITGSARVPIDSNLVHWSLSVDGSGAEPVPAARRLGRESKAVVAFLHGAGIPASAIAAEVVQSETQVRRIDKKHMRTTYHVFQAFEVSTTKIDVVEAAASNLGQLLERGIAVSADPLAYISTDLEQAKLQALKAATEETRHRAEILVGGLGGKLGAMRASSLGVYQITPRNSTDVSDYGVNSTSTRLKDVTAVVSGTFAVHR